MYSGHVSCNKRDYERRERESEKIEGKHAVIMTLPGSAFGGRQNSLNVSRILLLSSRSSFGLSNNGYRLGKTRFSKICRSDENIPFLTLSVNGG